MIKLPPLPECLACPIDGRKLTGNIHAGQNLQLHCANGHCFDVARQGYVNLLGVNDKRSKDPGDSKAMIVARSNILAAGLYEPVAGKLSALVNQLIGLSINDQVGKASAERFTILDAGCGEGYYLQYCIAANNGSAQITGIGLDISKWAIQAAARRSSTITWLVGSNRKPPLLEASVDLVICGFGFPDFSAFRKILKPGGYLIMLDPAKNHLLELRKIIYPVIKPYKKPDFLKALEVEGKIKSVDNLTYKLDVGCQQIADILTMSPHLYKASAEGKAAVRGLDSLLLTVDVNYTLIQF